MKERSRGENSRFTIQESAHFLAQTSRWSRELRDAIVCFMQEFERHAPLLLRPLVAPEQPIDMHDVLRDAIERELQRRFGGNAMLDRLEAEAQLERLLGHDRWPSIGSPERGDRNVR